MRKAWLTLLTCIPFSAWGEIPPQLPQLWDTITPSPGVETLYLREALQPPRTSIFRDLGTIPLQQSPHHGHITLDSSATVWSSDCQISDFFLQSQIALQTLDFNF